MIELKGTYGTAKVFTDTIEPTALKQINLLLDQWITKDCNIRIMPDVHAGIECVVGFTADLNNIVIPTLIGADIGCGVLTIPLGNVDIDYRRFDKVVRKSIAYGLEINKTIKADFDELEDMYCYNDIIKYQQDKILRAIGSLGSGNHFIEIDESDSGDKYLLIHSGSRHLGLDVCEYYQKQAIVLTGYLFINLDPIAVIDNDISLYPHIPIKDEINPIDFSYLKSLNHIYLHDMAICQNYAALNRFTIAKEILENYFNDSNVRLSSGGTFKLKQKGKYNIKTQWFDTVHNYIGPDNITRKGAVAAYKDQLLVIPINMRDGTLICKGKGNKDWNYSAPHGAGRIMSRSKAKETISLSDYKNSMKGIYSSCINENTIDESAFAYKNMSDILDNIKDTVTVEAIIKPRYNFKADNREDN